MTWALDVRRPSNKRTFHVARRLRTTAAPSRCTGESAAHDRWRCTCASGVGAPMYRSKLRSTTSSAAPSAPLQYRELDLCAGGAARSRLSGAPPFAGVVARAPTMPDTDVDHVRPEALELEPVWVSKDLGDDPETRAASLRLCSAPAASPV